MVTKKAKPKKKAAKKTTTRTTVVYVRERRDDGMSDLARMAVDGAVVMGSIGLMGTMAGAFSKK